jgi:hypothetical protein
MAYVKLSATLRSSGAMVVLLVEPNDAFNTDDPRFQQHVEAVWDALRGGQDWLTGIGHDDGFPAMLRCAEVAFAALSLVD